MKDYLEKVANDCTVEENRLEYTKDIPKIIDILNTLIQEYKESGEVEGIKQGLRALGNLCFDCDTNRDMVLECGGIPVILKTFSVPLQDTTFGCVLNLSMDNELVQQQLIEDGIFKFLEQSKSDLAIQILSNLLESDKHVDCIQYLLDCFDDHLDAVLIVLETISEQDRKQFMLFEKRNGVSLAHKVMDCIENGIQVHQLCTVLCTCTLNDACLTLVDDLGFVERLGRWIVFDLINARSSQAKRTEGSGLNSPDHQRHDIRMTACLCIGNLARSDENCKKLTILVEPLLKLVHHEMETERPNLKVVHAALGALRNLSLSQGAVLKDYDTLHIVSKVLSFPDLQALYTACISIIKNTSIDLDQVFDGPVQIVLRTVWGLPRDIDIGVRTETARFIVVLVRKIYTHKMYTRMEELVSLNAIGLVVQSITGGFMSGELSNCAIDQTKVFPSVQNEAIVCLSLCCSMSNNAVNHLRLVSKSLQDAFLAMLKESSPQTKQNMCLLLTFMELQDDLRHELLALKDANPQNDIEQSFQLALNNLLK